MASLYKLSEEYNNLLDVLEVAEDEEVKEIVLNSLTEKNEDIRTKTDNIVKFIRNLEADISALKDEEKRLSNKRKVVENSKKRIEKYLFDYTKSLDNKKLKGNLFEIGIKKNPAKLIVDSTEFIPSQFKTVETVETINNVELKKYIKDNPIKGCRLEQGESLKIK